MRLLGGLGALYGTGWVVMVLLPSWGWALALDTVRAFEPGSWHTLLTYAVVHPSLVYLVGMLLLSALALLILVQHMRAWQVIVLLVISAWAGAVLFAGLGDSGAVMFGSRFATWALMGAAVGCWMREGRHFSLGAHILMVGLAMVLSAPVLDTSSSGLTTLLVGLAAALAAALLRPRQGGGSLEPAIP